MLQLTPENRERIKIYAADITAQQSSPARDQILVLMGRIDNDLTELEAEILALEAQVTARFQERDADVVSAFAPPRMKTPGK
jgi:hypothetical protein